MMQIKDALLNSYEFWGNLKEEAQQLVDSLDPDLSKNQKEALVQKIEEMMKYWLDNEDNFRIDVELNYHKNPEIYEEKLNEFIKRFIKISI